MVGGRSPWSGSPATSRSTVTTPRTCSHRCPTTGRPTGWPSSAPAPAASSTTTRSPTPTAWPGSSGSRCAGSPSGPTRASTRCFAAARRSEPGWARSARGSVRSTASAPPCPARSRRRSSTRSGSAWPAPPGCSSSARSMPPCRRGRPSRRRRGCVVHGRGHPEGRPAARAVGAPVRRGPCSTRASRWAHRARTASAPRAAWLLLLGAALVGPLRADRLLAGTGRRDVAIGAAAGLGVLTVGAALASPVLRGARRQPVGAARRRRHRRRHLRHRRPGAAGPAERGRRRIRTGALAHPGPRPRRAAAGADVPGARRRGGLRHPGGGRGRRGRGGRRAARRLAVVRERGLSQRGCGRAWPASSPPWRSSVPSTSWSPASSRSEDLRARSSGRNGRNATPRSW